MAEIMTVKEAPTLPVADSHGAAPLIGRVYDESAGKKNVQVTEATPDGRVSDKGIVPAAGDGGAASKLSKEFPSPFVLAGAFGALKYLTGNDLTKPGVWNPKNPEQQFFAEQLPQAARDLPSLPRAIKVDGAASVGDPGPVNDFLKKAGMDIQLKKGDKNSLFVAGTESVEDSWKAKAKTLQMDDGKEHPSVYKNGKVHEVNNQQVAEIHSTDDMRVYAIPLPKDKENMTGVDVQKYAQSVVAKIADQEKAGLDGQPGKVEFPMTDLSSKQELTGLIGLQSKNGSFQVAQAKMQTQLQMDEFGFKAKQAAAMEVTRSLSKDPPAFQVKGKFIFAVATPSGQLALATQVDYDDMKRPAKTN
jgi:hypothetical protein